jgi:hypothetical protein
MAVRTLTPLVLTFRPPSVLRLTPSLPYTVCELQPIRRVVDKLLTPACSPDESQARSATPQPVTGHSPCVESH